MTTITPYDDVVREMENGAWLGASNGDLRAAPLYYDVLKRALDLVLAVVLLLLTLPLLLVVAALIKLDSPGPVFFVQERVSLARWSFGRGPARLRTFRIVKFRTMRADADSSVHEAHIKNFVNGTIPSDGSSSATFKLTGDPRVTRVGKYLRRMSLDELPQLVNVVLGDMSLVGPRPLPVYEVVLYEGDSRARFLARPGITGLWQVSGRADLSFSQMLAVDLDYVRRRSVGLDLAILARTLPAVLKGRGAG